MNLALGRESIKRAANASIAGKEQKPIINEVVKKVESENTVKTKEKSSKEETRQAKSNIKCEMPIYML
jgi:hypothetical protein